MVAVAQNKHSPSHHRRVLGHDRHNTSKHISKETSSCDGLPITIKRRRKSTGYLDLNKWTNNDPTRSFDIWLAQIDSDRSIFPWPTSSPSRTWSSSTTRTSGPSTTSPSPSPRARSSASSVRTARARAPPSRYSPRLLKKTSGDVKIKGFDVEDDAREITQHHRLRLAGDRHRHRPHRPGEHLPAMPLLPHPQGQSAAEGERAAQDGRSIRRRRPPRRHVLRRHEEAARPGHRTRLRSGHPFPGRADHRPRPAIPPRYLGPHPRSEQERHDHFPHHPVHGGGRSAGPPPVHHRQRQDRRRGRAGQAQGSDRRRHDQARGEERRRPQRHQQGVGDRSGSSRASRRCRTARRAASTAPKASSSTAPTAATSCR